MKAINNEIELIEAVLRILNKNPKVQDRYQGIINSLTDKLCFAKANTFRLGVIGVTSSGKSTMINALLGEKLLPERIEPSSSQLVRCRHGKERMATIFFEDAPSQHFSGKNLNSEAIGTFGDEVCNSKNKKRVREIEIVSPRFPFSDQLLLVDSPGLEAYGFDEHEKLTMSTLLPIVDFCVFMTICGGTSDEKTLDIINEIAEYDKPIIVVQNMIDSLRESVDGKESIDDVARKYKKRTKGLIGQSIIRDKESTNVVQISAKWALEGRTKENEEKLLKSNYNQLVDAINVAFSSVRPKIESNRIRIIKTEIDKMVADAEKDTSNFSLIEKFQFGGLTVDLEQKRQSLENAFDNIISKLEFDVSQMYYDDGISGIHSFIGKQISSLNSQSKQFNQYIEKLCKKLNLDSREVFSKCFSVNSPTFSERTKTELQSVHVDREYKFGRWLEKKGVLKAKYELVSESVTDDDATINDIRVKLKSLRDSIKQLRRNWLDNSIRTICDKINKEITLKYQEYEDRKQKALDEQTYKRVATELKQLSNQIVIPQPDIVGKFEDTNIQIEHLSEINVDKTVLSLLKLSNRIRLLIHQETMKFIVGEYKEHLIFGWNKESEVRFLNNVFGVSAHEEDIKTNVLQQINQNKNIFLCHEGTDVRIDRSIGSNVYVLINAFEEFQGTFLDRLSKMSAKGLFSSKNKVFLVIQNFQSVITAEAITESLRKTIRVGKEIGIEGNYLVLLDHDNPIYNLAAIEAQKSGKNNLMDEISINSKLLTLSNLLNGPDNQESKKTINEIIKTINTTKL